MKKQVDKVNHFPAADKVFEAIHSVTHLYRSARAQAFREAQPDITHMESRVLDYFGRHPGATLSDLVAHSGKDKAQLTRLIRGLREAGRLEAREDAEDRRSVRLQLSASGKAMQGQLAQCGAHILQRAVAGLSQRQCDELVALLKVLQDNLEEGRQDA